MSVITSSHTTSVNRPGILAPESLFIRQPQDWVKQYGCECVDAGIGLVKEVKSVPVTYTAGGGGALPGLTPDETALLAALLTALALFLLLLLPLLCCLLPWLRGGAGKRRGAHKNERRGNRHGEENETFWSSGNFGKHDYDDVRLPRPYVEQPLQRIRNYDDGEWEGIDVAKEDIDSPDRAKEIEEFVNKSNERLYATGNQSRRGSTAAPSTADHGKQSNSGEEVITEYTTTRRLDMSYDGGQAMSVPQTMTMSTPQTLSGPPQSYYGSTYSGQPEVLQDNLMKVYYSYKSDSDRKSIGGTSGHFAGGSSGHFGGSTSHLGGSGYM